MCLYVCLLYLCVCVVWVGVGCLLGVAAELANGGAAQREKKADSVDN